MALVLSFTCICFCVLIEQTYCFRWQHKKVTAARQSCIETMKLEQLSSIYVQVYVCACSLKVSVYNLQIRNTSYCIFSVSYVNGVN